MAAANENTYKADTMTKIEANAIGSMKDYFMTHAGEEVVVGMDCDGADVLTIVQGVVRKGAGKKSVKLLANDGMILFVDYATIKWVETPTKTHDDTNPSGEQTEPTTTNDDLNNDQTVDDTEGVTSSSTTTPQPNNQKSRKKQQHEHQHERQHQHQHQKEKKPSKKERMKTAGEVKDRILWDDDLPIAKFFVGYEDRFVGVMEKPFSAFNWADLGTLSHTETAIPQHRIAYFKYRKMIVWDKNTRVDHVFGSTPGSEPDIVIVMKKYDALHLMSEDDVEADVTDDDGGRNKNKRHYPEDPTRPNYFVCIRVTNPQVVAKAREIQTNAVAYDSRLGAGVIVPEKLHVTILMLRLNTPDEFEKAIIVVNDAKTLLSRILPAGSRVQVRGVDVFRDRVLHGCLHPTDALIMENFHNELKKSFQSVGLEAAVSSNEEYTAHMTLLKFNREMSRTLGRLEPAAYACYDDTTYFGKQEVVGVELCKVGSEVDDDGFYVRLVPTVVNDGNAATVTATPEYLLSVLPAPPCVVVVRGVPGSGKSTIVHTLTLALGTDDVAVCSADDYFIDTDTGEYSFRADEIGQAHGQCQAKFASALKAGTKYLVVDNTNMSRREYTQYEELATTSAYNVAIFETVCGSHEDLVSFCKRGKHAAPIETVERMFKRWEAHDGPHHRVDTRQCYSDNNNSNNNEVLVSETDDASGSAKAITGDLWQGGDIKPPITKLFVFDFDGTLCSAPDATQAMADWERATGTPWRKRGWWAHPESLHPPTKLRSGPVLPAWRHAAGQVGSFSAILTLRLEPLRPELERVLPVLLPGNQQPNKVFLRPMSERPADNAFANFDGAKFKVDIVRDLIRDTPTIKHVTVWDDLPANIVAFQQLKTAMRESGGPVIQVIDATSFAHANATKVDGSSTIASFLSGRGLLHSRRTTATAQQSIELITNTWKNVLVSANVAGTKINTDDLAAPFGSFVFGRTGDVDLCLFGPSCWTIDYCIDVMNKALTDLGVSTYIAHSSRCPTLKVRLLFSNSAPVDLDLIFSPTLFGGSQCTVVPHITAKPFNSKDVVTITDGVGFSSHVLHTLCDSGVSPETFGMAIETCVALLRANYLKGNIYHCLRTCHLVEVARRALSELFEQRLNVTEQRDHNNTTTTNDDDDDDDDNDNTTTNDDGDDDDDNTTTNDAGDDDADDTYSLVDTPTNASDDNNNTINNNDNNNNNNTTTNIDTTTINKTIPTTNNNNTDDNNNNSSSSASTTTTNLKITNNSNNDDNDNTNNNNKYAHTSSMSCDEIFRIIVEKAAKMSVRDWTLLCATRVPIEIISCYPSLWQKTSETIASEGPNSNLPLQTLEHMCWPLEFPGVGRCRVRVLATDTENGEISWSVGNRLRSRFPTFFRNLLTNEVPVFPGPDGAEITFAVEDNEHALEAVVVELDKMIAELNEALTLVVIRDNNSTPLYTRAYIDAMAKLDMWLTGVNDNSQSTCVSLALIASTDRKRMHDYAQSLGLESTSEGIGVDRCVIISRKPNNDV